jgi:RNA polymerase sigma-70 factor (ECF subfamily)
MSQKEDQYYIDKVLNGDASFYAVLVNRHKVNMYHIAVKILQNKEEAEEATQDAFIKAFKKIVSFKGGSKFSTWLYRISFNTAISYQRKKKLKFVPLDELKLVAYPEEEIIEVLYSETIEAREKKLKFAIQQLDGQEQLLLEMYYEKEMSTAEIATVMNFSKSNVKVKLYRSRKKLFQMLQPVLKKYLKGKS